MLHEFGSLDNVVKFARRLVLKRQDSTQIGPGGKGDGKGGATKISSGGDGGPPSGGLFSTLNLLADALRDDAHLLAHN